MFPGTSEPIDNVRTCIDYAWLIKYYSLPCVHNYSIQGERSIDTIVNDN